MNGPPNTNSQSETSRAPNRDSKSAPPRSAVEVENKLKEAQSSLMEAEGRLMVSTAAPAPSSQTSEASSPSRQEASRPPPERAPNAHARTPDTNDTPHPVVKPEPEKKEPPTEHIAENVAGALCYLFGWMSGLVFLFVDRRPFVRFHAAQSVAVFATLSILLLVLGGFFLGALLPGAAGVLLALRRIVELGWLIAAVVLMLKASNGEKYRVAGASEYADKAAHQGR